MIDLTPLHNQRCALIAMLRANAGARVDKVTRHILDSLDEQARIYIRRLDKALRHPIAPPYGSLGTFGENGEGPAIADIIRQAEFHRARGQQKEAA